MERFGILKFLTQEQITAGEDIPLHNVHILNTTTNDLLWSQPTGTAATLGITQANLAVAVQSAVGLNKFDATAAPTASNDSSQGYTVGSRWIDVTNDESYICLNSSVGAAVWGNTTVGTIAEVAGLQAALDLKAPLASPTLTGTIVADGTVRLGNGQSQGTSVTDATTVSANAASTGSTTIANTDIALRVAREGTTNSKWPNIMDVVVGSHTAGTAANTQVDFRLNNGNTASPDRTVLSLRANGDVLVDGSEVERVIKKNANNGYAGLDNTGKLNPAQLPSNIDYLPNVENSAGYSIEGKPVYSMLKKGTLPATGVGATLISPGAAGRLVRVEGWTGRLSANQRHTIESITPTAPAHAGYVYQDTPSGDILIYSGNAEYSSNAPYEVIVFYTK